MSMNQRRKTVSTYVNYMLLVKVFNRIDDIKLKYSTNNRTSNPLSIFRKPLTILNYMAAVNATLYTSTTRGNKGK